MHEYSTIIVGCNSPSNKNTFLKINYLKDFIFTANENILYREQPLCRYSVLRDPLFILSSDTPIQCSIDQSNLIRNQLSDPVSHLLSISEYPFVAMGQQNTCNVFLDVCIQPWN
jgi:hypothetical protein